MSYKYWQSDTRWRTRHDTNYEWIVWNHVIRTGNNNWMLQLSRPATASRPNCGFTIHLAINVTICSLSLPFKRLSLAPYTPIRSSSQDHHAVLLTIGLYIWPKYRKSIITQGKHVFANCTECWVQTWDIRKTDQWTVLDSVSLVWNTISY